MNNPPRKIKNRTLLAILLGGLAILGVVYFLAMDRSEYVRQHIFHPNLADNDWNTIMTTLSGHIQENPGQVYATSVYLYWDDARLKEVSMVIYGTATKNVYLVSYSSDTLEEDTVIKHYRKWSANKKSVLLQPLFAEFEKLGMAAFQPEGTPGGDGYRLLLEVQYGDRTFANEGEAAGKLYLVDENGSRAFLPGESVDVPEATISYLVNDSTFILRHLSGLQEQ